MKTALIAAAAVATLTGFVAAPASAAEVEIRNAVARVVVIVEDRQDIGVEVTQGQTRLPAIQVRRDGNDVKIDGGLRRGRLLRGGGHRHRQCDHAGGRQPKALVCHHGRSSPARPPF